jgi:hypothetical protein
MKEKKESRPNLKKLKKLDWMIKLKINQQFTKESGTRITN